MAEAAVTINVAPNGHQTAEDTQPSLHQVLAALKAIYDPRSSNQVRQDASTFLEGAKRYPQAPAQGFQIAVDTNNDYALRHFGLSMVEYYIKYVWDWDKDSEAEGLLRSYVLEFAKILGPQDPAFIRNKVGQLWTELVKRSWGIEWMNMDEQLVELWHATSTHKLLVLNVLETLAEEVFSRDDTVTGIRIQDLGDECTEIFMPGSTLEEIQSSKPKQQTKLRYGNEGWLDRFCRLLKQSMSTNLPNEPETHALMIKTLNAIRATLPWINLKAVAAVEVPTVLIQALVRGDLAVRTAVVEAMNVLYSRQHIGDAEFASIVGPLYSAESVSLLREAFQWALIDAQDIDDAKYDFLRKLSEAISHLGTWLELKPHLIPQSADLHNLFTLFITVVQHPSMIVSIPLLHVWARLLRLHDLTFQGHEYVRNNFGPLLELCRKRLIRYEALPDEFEDDTILYLQVDFDTVPERHAFIGTYRKYCVEVVESIVLRYPIDVIQLVLNEAKAQISNEIKLHREFKDFQFSKNSMSVILVDAHLTVIDAAVKGYHRWLETLEQRDPQQNEDDFDKLQDIWQSWCEYMMSMNIQDPEALRRVVTEIVTISNKVLNLRASFALRVTYFVLNVEIRDNPSQPQYSDAAKNCQYQCILELHRLAMAWPDDLVNVFEELETKINNIVSSQKSTGRPSLGYAAFLFIIVQRAKSINEDLRIERLQRMLLPVKEAWEDPEAIQACEDFGSFCRYLGFGQLPEFLSSRHFDKIEDWASQELDPEGQQIQADILQRNDNNPMKITKSMIIASFERLKSNSSMFTTSRTLWVNLMPTFLSNLLKMNSHAQAFMNMEKWSSLPPEMQQVIQRILQDRFWQSGISNETRDDFFARVSGSKQSYEGFASSVRGSVRQIRETAYNILVWLSRFKDDFYGIDNLPDALSEALYANARHMSSHHFSVLLNMSKHLIDGCPAHLRRPFLTPVLSKLFTQIDQKLQEEWDVVYRRTAQEAAGAELGDEMRTESILRQLTYSSIMLLYSLLDPQRREIDNPSREEGHASNHPDAKMNQFILTSPAILEPIFALLNSALRIRDTRTVTRTVDIIRIILPKFREPSPAHDFLCSSVLRNAILSFHEPFFVDSQRDLLKLISEIIRFDGTIPQQIILSLTGLEMDREKADRAMAAIRSEANEKRAKGFVWELLSSIRGVSIHEMGKIQLATPKKKKTKRDFMNTDGGDDIEIKRGGSPTLEGVGDMFG